MTRKNYLRGQQNHNQQQYEQNFVPSYGNANNQQQQVQTPTPEKPIQNNNDNMAADSADDSEGGIGAKMRKIFANRNKNLSLVDRKRLERERKARQRCRLRKLLTPKNAVVTLNELQGPEMSQFTINRNGQGATAAIVVNNVRYEATAANKYLAKDRASEKVLRDLVIAQMTKARQTAEKAAIENANNDVEMPDIPETDEVPMLHVASYALYKLFNEWQNEGFEVPTIKPPSKFNETGTHPLAPKVPKTKADLPSDSATRNPTELLTFMRPQIPFEDLVCNDPAGKREFSVAVTVDGQRFVGNGRSKKLARKEAAQSACQQLFDVQFVKTESTA